jgi:hypothetical protein
VPVRPTASIWQQQLIRRQVWVTKRSRIRLSEAEPDGVAVPSMLVAAQLLIVVLGVYRPIRGAGSDQHKGAFV